MSKHSTAILTAIALSATTGIALVVAARAKGVPASSAAPVVCEKACNPDFRRIEQELARIPLAQPQRLGSVRFGEPEDAPSWGFDRSYGVDFHVDDRGRFGILAHDVFMLRERDGRLLKTIALPKCAGERCSHVVAWIAADRWIVFTSTGFGTWGTASSASWLDVGSGRLTAIPDWKAAGVEDAIATGDGGFAVIAEADPKPDPVPAAALIPPMRPPVVIAYDARGHRRWAAKPENTPSGHVFVPSEFAAVATGAIAVRGDGYDSRTRLLKIYGKDGKTLHTIDVDAALAASGTAAQPATDDRRGQIVVLSKDRHHFAAVDTQGRAIGAFVPRYEDGQAFVPLANFQVDGGGHLWVDDGHALLRLDAQGRVDRRVGQRRDANRLGDFSSNLVVRSGRVYAVDAYTGAVHVFDEQGHRLQVLRPLPTDPTGGRAELQVSAKGDVFLSRTGEHGTSILHFAADGHRVGLESAQPAPESAKPTSRKPIQPQGDRRWTFVGRDSVHLVDAQGKSLSTWTMHTNYALSSIAQAVLAPDGSLLLQRDDTQHPDHTGPWESHVAVVLSPDGKEVASWKLPIQSADPLGIDFDGARFVERVPVDASRKQQAFVVTDAHGKPLSHFVLPVATTAAGRILGQFLLVPGHAGRELWVYAGPNRFDRYAIR